MIDLKYQLKADEIEESLLCLNWKKEGIRKIIHVYLLSFIAFCLLLFYVKNPAQPLIILCAFFVVALVFSILYVPILRRKKKIKDTLLTRAIVHIQITDKGIAGGDILKEYLFSDSKPMVLESESVYTIQMQKNYFCIPKRVLKDEKLKEVYTIIENEKMNVKQFKTKEG